MLMYFTNPFIDSKYIIENFIGRGGTSIIHKGLSENSQVTVKLVRKDKYKFTRTQEKEIIRKEWEVLSSIDHHPNIVKLLDYNLEGVQVSGPEILDVSYCVFELYENGTIQ